MKAIRTFVLLSLVSITTACGQNVKHAEVKEICSDDSPALVLPNEVVCNHSPSETIQVDGYKVTYMCTKIGEQDENNN